jgi:choline dehydrogenase-like flavoprotein
MGHGYSCHVCVLRPKSRGSVKLSSSDVTKAPKIDMGFFSDERDLDLMVKGFHMMRQVLEAPALAPWRGREVYTSGTETDAQLRTIIRKRADTVYHPVGSCKMGHDEMAVVDDQLRVHGIKGLRIADASIMPTLIGGNTNAPTIMIGEKCGDMIRSG